VSLVPEGIAMNRFVTASLLLSVASIFFALAAWIRCIAPVHAAASTAISLPDPWGQVGEEINVRAVEIGGLECAVLVQRDGAGRRTAIWCRPR